MTERSIGVFMRRCCMVAAMSVAVVMFAGCGKKAEQADTAKLVPVSGPKAPVATFAVDNGSKVCVVEVEGKKLLEGELQTQIDRLLQARRMDMLPPAQLAKERAQLRQKVIDVFVARNILLKEADKQGVTAAEADVNRAIDDVKAQAPEGVPFEQFLVSVGTSMAEFKQDIESGLRIEKLMAAQTSSIPAVTDADAEAFYNEQPALFEAPETVHARHVLIGCRKDETDATRAEKKAKAEEVHKKLVDGADFAAVAKEYSDCASKERGGDLGTFGRGDMVPPFEEAAFLQETNAIGPVVQTDFGYHVIQVLEHKAAGKRTLEEVKSNLMDYLAKKKQEETMSMYVEGLKLKAQIKYGDGTASAGDQPDMPSPGPKAN